MKDIIKKKWFWPAAIFITLVIIAVIGQATGLITPKETVPANAPIAVPTPITTIAPVPPAHVEDILAGIDLEGCIGGLQEELTNPDFFACVKDISVKVDQETKMITLTAVLDDATADNIAVDFGDTMIRRFHLEISIKKPGLKTPEKDYYGEVYDTYSIALGVAPASKTNDTKEWWVAQNINAGRYPEPQVIVAELLN